MRKFWKIDRRLKWQKDVDRILNKPWKEEKMAKRIAKKCIRKYTKCIDKNF